MMMRVDKVFGVRSEKGVGHWATGLLATVAACCCCKPHLPTLFIFKVKFAGSLFKYSLSKYFLIALKMRQLRKLWIWVWHWMKSPPKIANYWEKWTYNQVVIISEEHKSGVTEYFWAGWRLSSAYLQAAWNYLVFHQSSSGKMIKHWILSQRQGQKIHVIWDHQSPEGTSFSEIWPNQKSTL